ncbi:MAG: hypothetical protein ACK42Z_09920, partial [Candidatus Kapaibacteriota bacterium]
RVLEDFGKMYIFVKFNEDIEFNLTLFDFLGRAVQQSRHYASYGNDYIYSINKSALCSGIFYLTINTRNFIECVPLTILY